MSKPVLEYTRWGEEADGTPGSYLTEPTSGDRDTGFVPGEPSVADYVNVGLRGAHQWHKYLDAGALEGNHSIDGDLEVADDLEVGGDAAVTGDVEAANLYHNEPTSLTVGALEAEHTGMAYAADWSYLQGNSAADVAVFPITLPAGAQMLNLVARTYNDGEATEITGELFRCAPTGSPVSLGSAGDGVVSGWGDEIQINDLDTGLNDGKVLADYTYFCKFTFDGTDDVRVRAVTVYYKRPRPTP